MNKIYKNKLIQDIVIIIVSIIFAVILDKTGAFVRIITSTKELKLLSSFIGGIFYVSIFTAAPAVVTLGEIARSNSVFWTAFFGGLGSIAGDLVIFRFVRDRFSEHLMEVLQETGGLRKMSELSQSAFFKIVFFLITAFIIASPLPDELGIALLGFSRIRLSWFIPLSFGLNFLGILFIGIVARSVV